MLLPLSLNWDPMGYLKTSAILTRVREVLEDGAGTLRVISERFLGDLPEGLSEVEQMRRGLVKARVETSISSISRSPTSPPITGNFLIYEIGVDVRVVRTVTTLEQLSDDDRDSLMALAAEDADVVRQALEYPGNLTQTSAGVDTQLASGMLNFKSSRIRVSRAVDEGAQRVETIHNFSGFAYARPAIA